MSGEVRPRWRPAALQRGLLTVAAAGLVAALALGRPQLVLLAAPAIGAVLAGWLRPPPRVVHAGFQVDTNRLLEGEEFTARAEVREHVHRVEGTLSLDGMPSRQTLRARDREVCWTVRPLRWGRWRVGPARLRVQACGGLVEAWLEVGATDLTVFPGEPALGLFPRADRLARQIGEHVARLAGQGGELSAVRPLQPGDPARRINWPVSLRRQEWHVNEFFAEHAQDLLLVVDTLTDVGPPGRSSLDVAVRGAVSAAEGYLRHHDRVGLVVLGGILRWLRPDASGRQLYRIVDYLLDMPGWHSEVEPDITRVPPRVLPAGALVVLFSPLLDQRALHVIRDLRARGVVLLVVDVLTTEPETGRDELGRVAARLWRLERLAMRHELTDIGVPVLPWDGTVPLETAVGAVRRVR